MTALLEYIDQFLLNGQKGQIMLQISFKMPAQFRNCNSNHYAQNYSGIIPTPLVSIVKTFILLQFSSKPNVGVSKYQFG